MPRTTRRRIRRRHLKKTQRHRQLGGAGDLATWTADVKQARAELLREVGDVRTITFAKLAENKPVIDTSIIINNPRYPGVTAGDVANHLRVYLAPYFDSPSSYTMESVRSALASRNADTDDEDLSYTFLANIEALLSGQDTIDILNIQNYPLLSFFIVPDIKPEQSLRPILIATEPVVPAGQWI